MCIRDRGMILYRKGILSADKSTAYYKKMIWVGFVPGLILSSIGLGQVYASEWSGAYVMNIGANYKFLSGLFMALGYIGLFIWIYKKGIFKKLQNRLQATGRMAFTNYIGMSVICTLIFNGHGLGLFGKLDRLQQFLIVIGVWVIMLIISPLVLKKLNHPERKLNNVINFLGSSGKFSTLFSVKSFIEANGQTVTAYISPSLKDIKERFWIGNRYLTHQEIRHSIKIIEKFKMPLTIFEVLTVIYIIHASKQNTDYHLVEAGALFAKDSTSKIFDMYSSCPELRAFFFEGGYIGSK